MAMLNNQRVGVSKCDISQQPNPAPGPPDFSLSERGLDKGKRRVFLFASLPLLRFSRYVDFGSLLYPIWLVGNTMNTSHQLHSITRLDTT